MQRFNSAIEQVNNQFKEDKYKFSIQELIETCKNITCNQEEIETLEDIVNKGNTSEQQIITCRDYILTSINPIIPLPSSEMGRESNVLQKVYIIKLNYETIWKVDFIDSLVENGR